MKLPSAFEAAGWCRRPGAILRAAGRLALMAVLVALPIRAAQARDLYQSTIVEDADNGSGFHLLKSGSKVKIKPSTKAGEGGFVLQLLLKHVDCPDILNFKAKPGLCGTADAPVASPVRNHVLELSVRAAGTELLGGAGNPTGAGVLFRLEKGKAIFQKTGKNKVDGSIFGALATAIFNQPLGIGLIRVHTAGSNVAECATAPLLPGNGCTDGDIYAMSGITVGSDAGLSCSADAECGKTQICDAGLCAPEPCTVDADCDEGGGVGSFQCGDGGTCCDPAIDATCAAQVP
jgi:hypothetical protein